MAYNAKDGTLAQIDNTLVPVYGDYIDDKTEDEEEAMTSTSDLETEDETQAGENEAPAWTVPAERERSLLGYENSGNNYHLRIATEAKLISLGLDGLDADISARGDYSRHSVAGNTIRFNDFSENVDMQVSAHNDYVLLEWLVLSEGVTALPPLAINGDLVFEQREGYLFATQNGTQFILIPGQASDLQDNAVPVETVWVNNTLSMQLGEDTQNVLYPITVPLMLIPIANESAFRLNENGGATFKAELAAEDGYYAASATLNVNGDGLPDSALAVVQEKEAPMRARSFAAVAQEEAEATSTVPVLESGTHEIAGEDTYAGKRYDLTDVVASQLAGAEAEVLLDMDIASFAGALMGTSALNVMFAALAADKQVDIRVEDSPLSVIPFGKFPYDAVEERNHKVFYTLTPDGGEKSVAAPNGEWEAPPEEIESGKPGKVYQIANVRVEFEKRINEGTEDEPIYVWIPDQRPLTPSSDTFMVFEAGRGHLISMIASFYGADIGEEDNAHIEGFSETRMLAAGTLVFMRNPSANTDECPAELCDSMIDFVNFLTSLGLDGMLANFSYNELLNFADTYFGDPINTRTGGYAYSAVDATIATYGGAFTLVRSYESGGGNLVGLFGRGWSSPLSARLIPGDGGSDFLALLGSANVLVESNGSATGSDGCEYTLSNAFAAQITLNNITTGDSYVFNDSGRIIAHTDKKGNTTQYSYDNLMCLTGITLDTGAQLAVTTDGLYGIAQSITLPNGARVSYGYDANWNLTSVTDANGGTVRYEYDANDNMTSWIDQNGVRSVTNEYDGEGRVVRQTDGNGNVYSVDYGQNMHSFTDGEWRVTIYELDDNRNPTRITYHDGKVEMRSYDNDGRLLSHTSRGGLNTYYAYDGDGNLIQITRSDGKTYSFTYDSNGNMTSENDYEGNATYYEYDAMGNLTKETNALGYSLGYSYNSRSQMVSASDYNGNVATYTYNGANLASYLDPEGNLYQYGYNAMGDLTSILDPMGNEYKYTYSNRAELTSISYPDGSSVTFGYDGNGNLVSWKDGNGHETKLTYDNMDSLSAIINPLGGTTSISVNATLTPCLLVDEAGGRYELTLDALDRVTAVNDPLGYITNTEYDDDGNAKRMVDARGNTTYVEYDLALGLPVKVTDRLGHDASYEYDAMGNITKANYPDDSSEGFEYDALYRLISYTDPEGNITSYGYDKNGNTTSVTDALGRTYIYTYDKNNNITSQTDPMGIVLAIAYDKLNYPKSLTDGNGYITYLQYDALGRLKSKTNPLGESENYEYDKNGNLSAYADGEGNRTEYSYDAMNRLVLIKDALNGETKYTYDALGNLLSERDPLLNTTAYEYDALSRLVKVVNAEGGIFTMTYDANGNALTFIDANGNESKYECDAENRLTLARDAMGLEELTQYDPMGRVLAIKDNAGNALENTYSKNGYLLSQTNAIMERATFSYDAVGRIMESSGFDGWTWLYEYDDNDRLTGITDPIKRKYALLYDANGNVLEQNIAGHTYTYEYDAANRLISETDPLNGISSYAYNKNGLVTGYTDPNNSKTLYAYDKLSRLVGVTDPRGNGESYAYDASSRMVSFTDREGSTTTYLYDGLHRLIEETNALGNSTTYAYDALGNLTQTVDAVGAITQSTYSAHNLPLSVTDALGGVTMYEYDLNGALLSSTDALGAVNRYAYDVLGRLVGLETPLGYQLSLEYDSHGDVVKQLDSMGRVAEFQYDAMHRMTQAIDAERGITKYTYDEMDNITGVETPMGRKYSYTYDPLGQLRESLDPFNVSTTYEYDAGGNLTSAALPENRAYMYAYDANGNLTSVKDALGNEQAFAYDKNDRVTDGVTAMGYEAKFTYDALGNVLQEQQSDGRITQYGYNAVNALTSVTDPMGNITGYSYDLNGRMNQVEDALNGKTNYTYDAVGNLTTIETADGAVTKHTYDLEGNITSITDALGRTEKYAYDAAGRLMAHAKKDGKIIAYSYDKLDNLVQTSLSSSLEGGNNYGTLALFVYDADGYLIQSVNENGSVKYGLDAAGQATKIRQADGSVIEYTYDAAGRITRMKYPDGSSVTYTYDQADRLISVTDSKGTSTVYAYDNDGRLLSCDTNGMLTSYEYNANGKLQKKETRASGKLVASYEYEYDAGGNIVKESTMQNGESYLRTYSYDALDRLTGAVTNGTFDGKSIDESVAYEYDARGNRIAETINGVRESSQYNARNQLVQKGNVHYTYDANGNRVRESTLNASGKETAWVSYEYNALDQLVAIYSSEQATDDGILRSYGYDAEGNRLYEQRYYLSAYAYEIEYDTFKEVKVRGDLLEFLLAFGDDNYYYRRYVVEDPFYETPVEPVNVAEPLPEEEKEPSASGSDGEGVNTSGEEMPSTPVGTGDEKIQEANNAPCFFWYGFGQGVARTAILPPLNEWLSQLWNLLWRFPAEKNEEEHGTASLPANEGTTAGEDNPDGIVDLIPPTTQEESTSPIEPPEEQDAPEPNISVLHEWVPPVLGFGWLYGENRSVWVPDETVNEMLVESYTTYDLIWYVNDVNREHTEVLLTKDESNAFTRRYTYGNERISWEYLSNNTAGQYIHDGRGSATMLLNSKTSAVQVNHYYSAYGEVQSIWNLTGTPQAGMWDAYRYNAEDYDAITGLSYLRARYLSNDTASFMTVDLYLGNLAEPLSLNLYMYVQGNPVRWVDPSGHWAAESDEYGRPIRTVMPKPAVPPPNSSLNWNEASHTRLEVQESMISEVNSRGGLVIPQVPQKPMTQTKHGDETWNEVWTNAAKELGSKCDTLGDGPSKNQRLTILMVAYSFMRTDIEYGRDRNSDDTKKGIFTTIDCSQFTRYAYSIVGIELKGSAESQYNQLNKSGSLVDKDELIPGDLVFWYYADETEVGHVAIYVGTDDKGKIYSMEASRKQDGIILAKEWGTTIIDANGQKIPNHYIVAYGRPKG